MSRLIIIRGIPGSSKSTYARKLLFEKYVDDHFEADMYFMKNNQYIFDVSKLHEAHKWCFDNVRQSLKQGKNVVVSNTFTTLKELKPYLDLNNDIPDLKISVIRMVSYYGSIHSVPNETIEKMKNRFQDYPCEALISND